MKRLYYSILFISFSIIAFNCQKEIRHQGPVNPGTGNNNIDPITATLQGNIIDETGKPVMGVSIKVGNKTASTNVRGYFRIINAALDKNTSLVTAEKAGYFKSFRSFSATSGVNQVMIQLIKRSSTGTISAASGGTVSLANGSKITLPSNSVVKTSGGAYAGNINVYAAYIDPTDPKIGTTVPGSFLANDKDNKRVILASYGMLAVELESSAGEKLQIASGSTATLTTVIPSSLQASAPASIKLWYLDEQTGIWKEEGVAAKNGSSYVGEVKHFTYWNCDIPGPTINFTATFKNADGLPLTHAYVRVMPASANVCGAAYGYTDSLGQISGAIPANMVLTLEILTPCFTALATQTIGPFSSNANLGTITLDANPAVVTVTGRLLNCNGVPVAHGFAVVNFGYFIRYASVTGSNGEFTTSFTTCGSMPTTCEVYGVDSTAMQQGATVNVTVNSPVTNAGNITACGTSALQYINYTVDGIGYSLSSLVPSNLIFGITHDSLGVTSSSIYGYNANGTAFSFDFNDNRDEGTYQANSLHIMQYPGSTLIQPMTVVITNFPDASGQYFEGTLSGQFKDALNVTRSISCTFRVRRN